MVRDREKDLGKAMAIGLANQWTVTVTTWKAGSEEKKDDFGFWPCRSGELIILANSKARKNRFNGRRRMNSV